MEAFESNLVIFLLNLSNNIFNLTFLSLEIQEIFMSTEVISFSGSKSFHKGLWLELFMEFFNRASSNVINFQDFLIEINNGFFVLFTNLLSEWRWVALGNFQNGLFSTIELFSELSKLVSLEVKHSLFLFG